MSQRQSQNLSLDDSLTFSRAFERRRKLTTQAEQSSKITDRADLLDRAVSLDHHRKEALISSNVDEFQLFSSSTSSQFSSSESQLSSLSWWSESSQSESSSLRHSWSDSFTLSLCSEYWKNKFNISKDKAERLMTFSAAEVAAHAKLRKEQQN